ncbi:MAG TPA: AI-2E family transporter [Solirubrobacterales bacterium]|nr:AI-2E family transporter [Solirubrobacterales bacterium]
MTGFLWPATRVAANLIVIGTAVVLSLWLLSQLRIVVVPVLVAVLVATLLVPPTDHLRRLGVPSAIATGFVMLLSVLGLAGIFALIGPPFIDQFDELEQSVEEGIDEVVGWLVNGPLHLQRGEIDDAIDRGLSTLGEQSGSIGQGVLSGASLLAEMIAGLLLLIVLVFFFVHDGRSMWSWAVSLAPKRHRETMDGAGREVWVAVSGYMRGVALIAVVDAVLIGIALALIGVPLVVPLMVVVFLGAFIPLVGAFVAGAVAVLVALISEGIVAAGLVAGAIFVIQQVEGDLLYPNIVGRVIRLHPVAILLALTAGTVVAGIVGALLAVPIAAAAWVAFDYARNGAPQASGS